jgi:hypothetical protein
MTAYLVTQRKADAALLSRLVGPEVGRKLRVQVEEAWSEAVSGARARLLEGCPVALVLDAGSRKALDIARHRGFLQFGLGLAGPGFMWRVLLVKPEIARLYFRDAGVLRQLVGHVPSEEQLARARSEPRRILAELLGVPLPALDAELLGRLETVDVRPLARLRSLQRLRDFLHAHTEAGAPPPGLR